MTEFRTLHRRDIIRGVRDRWMNQYRGLSGQTGWGAGSFDAVRDRLKALDLETATQADVDTALGVNGWAANRCDVCDEDFETLMQVGNEPDYEARYIDICQDCAAKLLASFPAKP